MQPVEWQPAIDVEFTTGLTVTIEGGRISNDHFCIRSIARL